MSQNEPEEEYLTVAEVAGNLKLNQQTVRNWIDQGSLPAVRVGRRVRIKRSDLDRILDQGYRGGGQEPREPGPSADDFWGGQPVGMAEVDPVNGSELADGSAGRAAGSNGTADVRSEETGERAD